MRYDRLREAFAAPRDLSYTEALAEAVRRGKRRMNAYEATMLVLVTLLIVAMLYRVRQR